MIVFHWEFFAPDEVRQTSLDLPLAIHNVFCDGFEIDGWSLSGIETSLQRCDMLGLLLDQQRSICGYALYSVPQHPFCGASLLWEDSICLKKKAQGKGFSTKAIELALALYPGRAFGWLGGRTQNPVIMRRYSRQGTTFPFDIGYEEQEGPRLIQFLLQNVPEVRAPKSFNIRTGICSGVYRRRLGNYPWHDQGEFERHLLRSGFDRDKGDAVVVVARLETQ